MKLQKFNYIIIIAFVWLSTACQTQTQDLLTQLNGLPNVSVEKIVGDTTYAEYYEMWFTQPIDHNNPKHGTFKQRVFFRSSRS